MGLLDLLFRPAAGPSVSGFEVNAGAQPAVVRVRWVRQQEGLGCGIAAIAMVLGTDYARAREMVPAFDPEKGLAPLDLMRVLGEHGWAWQEKFAHYSPAATDRGRWPVPPFAPLHLCGVGMGAWHAVVMLADGRVLDPLTPRLRRLGDYRTVHQIYGLWKVG